MGRVDPEDDSVERHVVFHFRYDPLRKERRQVAVAAFDNEPEYQAFFDQANADILARQAAGEAEPCEHVSGQVLEPGYARRRQNARLLRRALEHGVLPTRLDLEDLPPSVGVLRVGRDRKREPAHQRLWQRIRRWAGR